MKFDRETMVGIIICAVILFGWEPFMRAMGWMPAKNAPQTVQQTTPAAAPQAAPEVPKAPQAPVAPQTAAPSQGKPAPNTVPAEAAKIMEHPAQAQLPPIRIANAELEVTIAPAAGTITAIGLKGYLNAARTAPIVIDTGADGALGLGAKNWLTVKVVKQIVVDAVAEVTREMVDLSGQRFTVTQRWELPSSGYVIKYSASVANPGRNPLTLPETVVCGGTLVSAKQLAGDNIRRASHTLDYQTVTGEFADIAADKKDSDFFAGGNPLVLWTSVSNKYFCMILDRSGEAFALFRSRTNIPGASGGPAAPSISAGAVNPGRILQPGEMESFGYRLYCGPKILHLLKEFSPATTKVMHLTWGPLNYLARFMLWVLVKLHALTGNYGWSIIILTLLVRILFYPVTARGNASMKKMQAIQPKVKELREKYKDNPQLMNSKMMELYRAEGVNPFGGCLPILLQIPVFFALYATLEGAVELRQSSFFWCHDLAAADTIARVNLYFFTLPINPLVLAMTGLMVLQQHMTPMSMDPAQKKMMMLMPFVMLFFFYDLPSGLTLYWTVSNIFSIIQLRLQQRSAKTTAAAGAAQK